MSNILPGSVSSFPSATPAELPLQPHANDTARYLSQGIGSDNATPAPETAAPAVASTSTPDQELITVDGDVDQNDCRASRAARSRVEADMDEVVSRVKKRASINARTTEDATLMLQTAARVAERLAADHDSVLYPDVDAPFADAADVVKRLLPYHVFQHPQEDLAGLTSQRVFPSRKGKRKATEEDLLREDIAGAPTFPPSSTYERLHSIISNIIETKFALDCWRRRRALEERFRRARTQSGKRPSPDDQAYILAQAVLDGERTETANATTELRAARAELDKLEREKRAAAQAANPRPASYYRTANTTPATYATQYRGYSYPYAQAYGASHYTFSPAFQAAPTTYPGVPANPYAGAAYAPAAQTATSSYSVADTRATTTTSVAASTPPATRPGAGSVTSAIPVQLPLTSLEALKSINLEPVPVQSLPPPGQPQPAAVLRSQNGTMMYLEINVGSLQPSQMSGLAVILNALTSRGAKGNAAGATGARSGTPSAAEVSNSSQSQSAQ
ncbi:uncharacterized protein FIBRA_03157 [Fibroporia radiculosa]|uniref:GLTSCR protein conserved domain-containing protein n=1 Tax=Fibroporia radiculosa TaxID=599839 RepID=J4H290_9APHY|nr:uncharacterized protein FIBRA_03157 [Fibroporia radiculosa]CCM01109.1 predicted protein [Fibroporia radiculosa]